MQFFVHKSKNMFGRICCICIYIYRTIRTYGYVLFIRSTIKVPISISSLVTTALLVRMGSIRKSNETSNVLDEHIPLVDFDITVS
jgi:hypothetical protein